MSVALENPVIVVESGNGPYAQSITIRHHSMSADEPSQVNGQLARGLPRPISESAFFCVSNSPIVWVSSSILREIP